MTKISTQKNVAIVGATGAVGLEMIKVLGQRNFPTSNLKLFASPKSIGRELVFKGETIPVDIIKEDSFKGVDIALFSAGASRSLEFAKMAVASGAVVIDNSSAFRMKPDVPIVIPEINPEDVLWHKGIIANPNCSTAIMALPVYPLHKKKGLRRIIASTYQAVSGLGLPAINELNTQTLDLISGNPVKIDVFPHQIAFNIFPHIDLFLENNYTKEEMKMVFESRKIMHLPSLAVNCTCVRIPVFRAHSESLLLEFEKEITPEEAKEILKTAPGVTIVNDSANNRYPMPLEASGQDNILVGRIRQDISRDDKKGLTMFISGDQLLKGAALNAIQIAELLIRKEE